MIAHNLPAQPTPFFSRTTELTEISSLLMDSACRLLTLVGPGGIGKTRLAVEAASGIVKADAGYFPQGVYFVALQPLDAPDLIVSAVTTALQLRQTTDAKQQLLHMLGEKDLLLVLDNFEHLLDGAELLSDILAAAPGVRLLVTSRERLNLREEWVMEVNGLGFPINERQHDIERYSAVQFFLQNAQRAQVGFQLTEGQKPAVARICRVVSGMPLAIELAATWVRVMSCEQIAAEIERSLDVLESPARNVPPRHRNMRAVFEPTWRQLSEAEQAVFMRLTVFRGGFTWEAAQAVASATLSTLSALVDKSLLKVDAGGRYNLHELLRQYGEEQLSQSGNGNVTLEAHSAYYADFLQQREADVKGRRQLGGLNEIEADFENIRMAWYWLVEHKNYLLIDRSLASLFLFCEMRSRFHEVADLFRHAWVKLAPNTGEDAQPVWGRILARYLTFAMPHWEEDANDKRLIRELREKALEVAQQTGSEADMAYALWRLGELANLHWDFTSAIAYLELSLAHFRAMGDRFYVAKVLNEIGFTYRIKGQLEKAIDFQQQSLTLRRAIGDEWGAGWCLHDMGQVLFRMNLYAPIEQHLRDAHELWRKMRDRHGVSVSAADLGYLAFAKGEFETGKSLSEEALEIAVDINNWKIKETPLTVLGVLNSLEGNHAEARRLCEQSFEPGASPEERPFQQWGMAVTLCGLQDYDAAHQRIATLFRSDRTVTIMDGLPVATVTLAHGGQQERAVELLAFISGLSTNIFGWTRKWQPFTDLQSMLEIELPKHVFTAAWERGMDAQLDAVLVSLRAIFQDKNSEEINTANQSLSEPLSERELEVLNAIAGGSSNSEIAAQMVVEVSTVKKHLTHIYHKLGVTSRTQAIAHARDLGLL